MAQIHLAARNWDHVVPIALGDLSSYADYRLERREITPDLWSEPSLDGGETSFSRYIRARSLGDFSITALPIFIMRGFRHRCIITRKDSPLESAQDLRGKHIGVTGWADTGNTWTRAILRRSGVEIADAQWRVGRLTSAHPVQDRIGPIIVPENVLPCEQEIPMMELLERGALDAVMTPFMPPGFAEPDSLFRTLYRNPREIEAQYYAETGYIPGIHLLAMQTEVLEANPERALEIVNLFEASRVLSDQRRTKLQDVTPWQNEAIAESVRHFGTDWMASGWHRNRSMIDDLQTEMIAQGLLGNRVTEENLFPYRPEPAAVLV